MSKANFDIINSLVAKTKTLIVEDTFISPVIYTDQLQALTSDIRHLTSETITATSSAFGSLVADRSQFTDLRSQTATISSLTALTSDIRDLKSSSISADSISAKYIKADHIEGLEAKFGLISNDLEATLSALLAKATLSEVEGSASQGHPLQGQGVALPETEAFLDANAAFVREFLAVTGKTSLTDTEIATSLVVGSSLALDHNSISNLQCSTSENNHLPGESFPHLGGEGGCDNTLYIQPTGQGRISLLADLMTLDDTGQVTVNGNLTVTGDLVANRSQITDLRSQTATVSALYLTSDIRDLTSASGFGNLLTISNPEGQIVAAIDASGSAIFSKLTIASPAATSSSDISDLTSDISINASVGTALLPAGLAEAKIPNTQVTLNSLIYLTPTTTTYNQVLYLKTKKAGIDFTVAIDQPISTDIEFQYWIIN